MTLIVEYSGILFKFRSNKNVPFLIGKEHFYLASYLNGSRIDGKNVKMSNYTFEKKNKSSVMASTCQSGGDAVDYV